MKNPENNFRFPDNWIWNGSWKLSVLLPEYSYLAVNVLTGSPKILDLTKNDFFYLKVIKNDEKVG